MEIDISKVCLETKRLILRSFRTHDLDDLYNYAHVEGVGEWAGWSPHKSLQESREILDIFIKDKNNFALCYKSENQVIGSLGLTPFTGEEVRDLDGVEIGYALAKDYWGQGLTTEAVEEVLTYLFDNLDLDYAVIRVFQYNKRSIRVAEKSGFTKLKTIMHVNYWGEEKEMDIYILYNPNYDI